MKLLTIVTINKNDAAGLLRTIKSVLPLVSDNVEYLIIDGASSDDSVRLATDLIGERNNIILMSEPDSGIYSAMNKGWALASGEYLAFVNSGDELIAEAYAGYLEIVAERNADVFYSKTYVCTEGGGDPFVHERHPSQFQSDTIPHLTTAVRQSLLRQCGGFDERYRIVADRDFFLRAKKSGACFTFYDSVISRFYLGGVSSGWVTKWEDAQVNFRHGHISRAKYYRKSCKYWWKQKIAA